MGDFTTFMNFPDTIIESHTWKGNNRSTISFPVSPGGYVLSSVFSLLLLANLMFPSPLAANSTLHRNDLSSRIASLIMDSASDAILHRDNSLWKRYLNIAWEEKHFPQAFPSHLSDNLYYLYLSLEEDRDQFLSFSRNLLRMNPDTGVRDRVKHYISSEELIHSRRLLREDTYNRLTMVLNRLSSAMTSLLQGQTQPLLQLPIDLAFVWHRFGRCSPRQRKSLFLLKEHLSRHELSERKPKIQARLAKLEQKRNKQVFLEELRFGRFFRKKGKIQRALFHFSNAASLGIHPGKAEKEIEALKRQLAEKERDRRASLSVLNGEDFFLTEKEKISYYETVYALVTQDLDALEEYNARFLFDYPESNYADDVQYAATAGMDLHTERSDILERLISLTDNHPGANGGKLAQAAMLSPGINPRHDLGKALKDYRARKRKYILFGGREMDEQVYILSSGALQSPSYAAQNLGVIFVVDVLIRGIRSVFATPLSMEDVIERAAFYERTCQSEAWAGELRTLLASIFLKKRQYGKALHYARKAGTFSEDFLNKLEDRHARQLYVLISQMPDQELKTNSLKRLISRYPHSSIIEQARRDLAPFDEESLYEFQISRKELMIHPELCGAEALNLNPMLIDGRGDNGEIDGEGVKAIREGPVVYRVSGVNSAYELPVSDSNRRAVARSIRQLREREERGEKNFPLEISGGVGSRGFEMYPLFIPIDYNQDDLNLFR